VGADRLERARSAIRALASDVREGAEYREGVLRVLGDVVPWEGAVLTPFDPATTLPTAGTGIGVDLADCHSALELEYHHVDVAPWTDLARSRTGVAVLSRSVDGDLDRSVRYRELYRGQGWQDELRATFRLGGACWGGATLLRSRRKPFGDEETATLATLGRTVAEGMRVLLQRGVAEVAGDGGSDGPAVITVGTDGEVEGMTPAARAILGRASLRDTGLRAAMQSVVARQRARRDATARVRLRTDGGWLVLRAGPLDSADGLRRSIVTVEPARPPEIVSVIAAGIGLSARETEVLHHLLAGRSSVEIGRQLFLSPHTVNDHVRHVYEKAGVRGRRELVAWLFFTRYAPTLSGAETGPPAG
jgi:DNA-binding CsgD family transcriptional regulator